jgi:hypothetical protein
VTVFLTCKIDIKYSFIFSCLERKKDSLPETIDRSVEEWELKNVIFVEDKQNIPVGKVLKASIKCVLPSSLW